MDNRKKRNDVHNQSFHAPKSKFSYMIEDELETIRETQEMKQKMPKQSKQKMANYVSYVREFHAPKASDRKSNELQELKQRIKTQPR